MRFYILLLSFIALPTSLLAEEKAKEEIDSRYTYIKSTYTINDDATHVEQHDWAVKVLNKRALNWAKETSISYSKSVQQADIIHAYTLKADNRRIDAPKTNYQVRENSGKDNNAPVFSDRVNITVVFPEVEVGDTIVFSHKKTQTQALFPGHLSLTGSYSRTYPYDEVKIMFNLPQSFKFQHSVREMKEVISKKKDRKIITLTYHNKKPIESKRRDFSVWDPETQPGFILTTFNSFKEIAEAYGKRATPKAAVTERVKKLANKIVGETNHRREQTRLLYEWVSTNITYAGNCIGVGAVVPHDLEFVLDNRMGDCKDHATLLQALLSAKNIKSSQALINSGNQFKLPSLPYVSAVNHVMNYIPEFDLLIDATSKGIPFGNLHFLSTGKPILLVDNYREGFKSPVHSQGTNQQSMKTTVRIQDDGSAEGEITISQKGQFAIDTRSRMRNVSKKQEKEWLKNTFSSSGHIGSGTMEKDDPKPLIDTYRYHVTFKKKELINRPGAGAFYVMPLVYNEAPVHKFITGMVQPVPEADIACSDGKSMEEYTYIFPENFKLLSIPDNVEAEGEYLKFTAHYELNENVLTVKRTLVDLSPVNICSPEVIASQREVALKAMQNLKSQIIYK